MWVDDRQSWTRLLLVVVVMLICRTGSAATDLWWDTAYLLRFNVSVSVGINSPDKGYAGYTARVITLDTQALIAAGDMQADCSDLRVAYFGGAAWQELPRHVLNCNSTQTDIRFMLVADIAANGTDDNYYIYHANPAAGAPPAVSPTNVYLWYDDATVDRSAQYTRGRIDNWHGSGWDDSLVWNPGGYYTYDTGAKATSGYRPAIDERDVYAEAEWFHTSCYDFNMSTGLMVRGIVQSGSGGNESSNHYYASIRGQYPGCRTNGNSEDGDIVEDNRQTLAVNGPNPPAVVASQWRRQGVAAWQTAPTNLSFWDEDASGNWSALGYPSGANLQVSGTDVNNENTGRGFAALMTSQDQGRIRNFLVRRFVFPEPSLVLTPETQPPLLTLEKSAATIFDPVNLGVNPRAIPGSHVDYTIRAYNYGAGEVDAESLVITEPLPGTVRLFVGDLGGGGPVSFVDGSGAAASGLTLDFGGLADTGDDVDFSTDGVNWAYEPVPDVDGFDPAVTHIRIRPSGVFQGTNTPLPRRFELRIRVQVL
jgi:hypothetical protein